MWVPPQRLFSHTQVKLSSRDAEPWQLRGSSFGAVTVLVSWDVRGQFWLIIQLQLHPHSPGEKQKLPSPARDPCSSASPGTSHQGKVMVPQPCV